MKTTSEKCKEIIEILENVNNELKCKNMKNITEKSKEIMELFRVAIHFSL